MAIGAWRLATGNSFHALATTFAVDRSTAYQITHELYLVLVQIRENFISFPITPLEVPEAIDNFRSDVNCEIPQSIGVVD